MYLLDLFLFVQLVIGFPGVIVAICYQHIEIAQELKEKAWPSKGVLWWAWIYVIIFIMGIIQPMWRSGNTVPMLFFCSISILGIAIFGVVCIWWYGLSKKLKRRRKTSRIIGYLLFGFGSCFPLPGVIAIGLQFISKSPNTIAMCWTFVLYFLLGAGSIVGAYYLEFQHVASVDICNNAFAKALPPLMTKEKQDVLGRRIRWFHVVFAILMPCIAIPWGIVNLCRGRRRSGILLVVVSIIVVVIGLGAFFYMSIKELEQSLRSLR